ncbi:LysE family translocator [Isoptericola halotolerans]|uniref:Threonine/homoserine/homoserine lactone efflux protein n=1 Tax=Isoptericola halotolerans TaxID=300560 RepID=A0ABX2A4C4_9MICO|nr:threonine/homoserine/homoserine lactone efflux protein [Isoptericola halotolerans]
MTVTQAVLAFVVVAGLLTVIPGMDTALVLRSTLTRSRRHGVAALGGIQVGTLLWGAAAAGGAAALLAASQTAYRVLTIAGAVYLVWMGVSMIAASLRRRVEDGAVGAPPPASGRWRHFGLGLGTNLMNPKVGVFYVAAIPQFTPAGVNPLLMGLLLATVHCVLGTLWLSAVLLGAGVAGPRLRRSGAVRWLDRVTGGLLVAFGARLAFEARA